MGNDYWTNGGPIKAFSSFREAQAFAAKLRAHEADGWQYEVRSVGPDCEFVIGTYDLDWRFYGYWREPEVSEAPAWPTIVSAATPASGAPKMAEEREVNAWRDVPVSSPACENCSGPLPEDRKSVV